MNQSLYAKRLKPLQMDCTFEQIRACWHEITWLTHARQDLCSAVSTISRTTNDTVSLALFELANTTIRKAQQLCQRRLRQQRLNKAKLQIIAYSDSSFANCDDIGTQLGFAILLGGDTTRDNWLTYSSYKCRKVVICVLGGITYAFVNCFDAADTVKHHIEKTMNQTIPSTMLTDSKSLFKVTVKSYNG